MTTPATAPARAAVIGVAVSFTEVTSGWWIDCGLLQLLMEPGA